MPRAQRIIDVRASLLTPEEVRAELNCCLASVYNLMNRGDLPWIRILNRGRRIRRSDLDAYLARNAKGGWNQ